MSGSRAYDQGGVERAGGAEDLSPLLDVLHRADGPVPIVHVARALGVGEAGVGVALDRLTAMGCRLDVHPTLGVTLRETGLGAWEDFLRWKLGCPPERVVRVYRTTTSTQDAARELARAAGGDGGVGGDAVVVADEQTAARGRLGRRWVTRAGSGLAVSRAVVVSDGGAAGAACNRLTLAGVVAVTRAIEGVTGLGAPELAIKWPNDVLLGGRKVAGVLVEVAGGVAVVGIGVNTAGGPVREGATSLADHGARVDRVVLLAEVLARLDEALGERDGSRLALQWRRRCPVGSDAMAFREGERTVVGRVVDVDADEGLIVRVTSGELLHLPAATTTVVKPNEPPEGHLCMVRR